MAEHESPPEEQPPETVPEGNHGPLAGLVVLDLGRILAAPLLTQILGDLGATIIKIERPGSGDDTRQWGPPFVESTLRDGGLFSAYYLAVNRNKHSLAIDITTGKGRELVRRLAAASDIVVENHKVGGLARYGLAYEDLSKINPGLIYCSITGFGQNGPLASRPGYDAMIQAMGGIMSITGEPGGNPVKVGVAIADVMTGMYGAVAILAALNHRNNSGEGQYIDLSLFDCQLSWLVNEGMNWLIGGQIPRALGSAHPNIVPYQAFAAADGHFMLAVGNDSQFAAMCAVVGRPELANDERFATNAGRVENREVLIPLLAAIFGRGKRDEWLAMLEEANVPCGPINSIPEALGCEQAKAREMVMSMRAGHVTSGPLDFLASPIKMSKTPVSYRKFPPAVGEDTFTVLNGMLGMSAGEIDALAGEGVISMPTGGHGPEEGDG